MDAIGIREDHLDDEKMGKPQKCSCVCALLTGMCDWCPVGALMEKVGEFGRIVGISPWREPDNPKYTESRPQGTVQVQYDQGHARMDFMDFRSRAQRDRGQGFVRLWCRGRIENSMQYTCQGVRNTKGQMGQGSHRVLV